MSFSRLNLLGLNKFEEIKIWVINVRFLFNYTDRLLHVDSIACAIGIDGFSFHYKGEQF